MLNKKLPAFTLMEVTIAMLIAAIAVAVTFTAYRIVSGSYLNFVRKQDRVAVFITADKLLKQDFLKARKIIKVQDGLALEMEDGMVNYNFNNAYLFRDQFSLRTDTFRLRIDKLNFLFENEVVADGDPVDQCSFETEIDKQTISLYYQKTYSAKDLFQ
ncbi:hypothetical protein DBR43_14955 [Pedobacter sp. KBW06]|uniref:PulJ/GspJ family protein n=1 Tax=Pedobacter sp. KBW06 TaxID=2153359 RepID=UPI000F5AFC4A|nr:hypothetical protein [Pedobacter sp. KBW06]RQO69383.1 hypothetical protein DBR43_14955 [Pedobacter sp. KBW06]